MDGVTESAEREGEREREGQRERESGLGLGDEGEEEKCGLEGCTVYEKLQVASTQRPRLR